MWYGACGARTPAGGIAGLGMGDGVGDGARDLGSGREGNEGDTPPRNGVEGSVFSRLNVGAVGEEAPKIGRAHV